MRDEAANEKAEDEESSEETESEAAPVYYSSGYSRQQYR
jgi:hypothetical protein